MGLPYQLMIASFASVVGFSTPARPQVQPTAARFPEPVGAYLDRRASCAELIAKKQRGKVWATLECYNLRTEELALRHQYSSNPQVLEALNGTWVKVVQRLPMEVTPERPSPDKSH